MGRKARVRPLPRHRHGVPSLRPRGRPHGLTPPVTQRDQFRDSSSREATRPLLAPWLPGPAHLREALPKFEFISSPASTQELSVRASAHRPAPNRDRRPTPPATAARTPAPGVAEVGVPRTTPSGPARPAQPGVTKAQSA